MTDLQYSYHYHNTSENIPGSNNRPVYIENDTLLTNNDYDYSMINTDGNKVAYKLINFSNEFFIFSPKLGINYNINSQWSTFINYSQTYNEPSIKYFYYSGQPNENVKLEISDDFEFGINWQYADLVNAKLNLYNINFKNRFLRITNPEMANQPGYDSKGRCYLNVGDSNYRGIEFNIITKIISGLNFNTTFTGMQNRWGRNITTEAKEEYGILPGMYEIHSPMIIINNGLNWDMYNIFGKLNYAYYSDYWILINNESIAVEWDASKDEYIYSRQLSPWGIMDLSCGYRFTINRFNGSITLHINNLLNEKYYQSANNYGPIPGAERNITGNLKFAF